MRSMTSTRNGKALTRPDARRVQRLNQRNQRGPGNYLVHLSQENLFANLFCAGIKAERGLIQDCDPGLRSGQAVVTVA